MMTSRNADTVLHSQIRTEDNFILWNNGSLLRPIQSGSYCYFPIIENCVQNLMNGKYAFMSAVNDWGDDDDDGDDDRWDDSLRK